MCMYIISWKHECSVERQASEVRSTVIIDGMCVWLYGFLINCFILIYPDNGSMNKVQPIEYVNQSSMSDVLTLPKR